MRSSAVLELLISEVEKRWSPCHNGQSDREVGFSTRTNGKLSSVTFGVFVIVGGEEGRREGGGVTAAERR